MATSALHIKNTSNNCSNTSSTVVASATSPSLSNNTTTNNKLVYKFYSNNKNNNNNKLNISINDPTTQQQQSVSSSTSSSSSSSSSSTSSSSSCSSSSRCFERNYSYIEAMKFNGTNNNNNAIIEPTINNNIKTVLVLPINVEKSKTLTTKQSSSPIKYQQQQASNHTTAAASISKSQSQSSILAIFKNTFSPFTLRKWRSKSRDKIATPPPPPPPHRQPLGDMGASNCCCSSSRSSSSNNKANNKSTKPITKDCVDNYTYHQSNKLVINLTSNNSKPKTNEKKSSFIIDANNNTKSTHIISPTMSSPLKELNLSNNSDRQLSYIKLSCLVNGYDYYNGNKEVNNNNNNENEKKTKLNNEIKSLSTEVVDIDEIAITTQQLKKEETPAASIVYDGNYFIKLLDDNTNDINKLCKEYKIYLDVDDKANPNYIRDEDIIGHLQTTIGKAQLLINQKFKQFRDLCTKNLRDKLCDEAPSPGEFVTRDDDLAGFWDMVCLQIDEIHKMFNFLNEMRKNNWNLVETNNKRITTNTTTTTTPIRLNNNSVNSSSNNKPIVAKRRNVPPQSTPTETNNNSNNNKNDSTTPNKAEAARLRLLEAKKNAFMKKREAEDRLLKQQQQQQEEDDEKNNVLNTTNNKFFNISN